MEYPRSPGVILPAGSWLQGHHEILFANKHIFLDLRALGVPSFFPSFQSSWKRICWICVDPMADTVQRCARYFGPGKIRRFFENFGHPQIPSVKIWEFLKFISWKSEKLLFSRSVRQTTNLTKLILHTSTNVTNVNFTKCCYISEVRVVQNCTQFVDVENVAK